MTKAEYCALPADKAIEVLWQLVERHERRHLDGSYELLQQFIADPDKFGLDSVERELRQQKCTLPMLTRFDELSGCSAGRLVRELAECHPLSEELVAEITRRREQKIVAVLDSMLQELDALGPVEQSSLLEPSEERQLGGQARPEPRRSGWFWWLPPLRRRSQHPEEKTSARRAP
jgi:hypothetical protein